MIRYYLDTNALYAFYRNKMRNLLRNPNYSHYETLQGGEKLHELSAQEDTEIFVSRLTYLEFISRLLRHARGKELKRRELETILEALEQDMGRIFHFVPQTDTILSQAQRLLLEYGQRNGCALDTNDAIHIATAKDMQPPVILVTSDGGKLKGNTLAKMKCVCEKIGLTVFDPEL